MQFDEETTMRLLTMLFVLCSAIWPATVADANVPTTAPNVDGPAVVALLDGAGTTAATLPTPAARAVAFQEIGALLSTSGDRTIREKALKSLSVAADQVPAITGWQAKQRALILCRIGVAKHQAGDVEGAAATLKHARTIAFAADDDGLNRWRQLDVAVAYSSVGDRDTARRILRLTEESIESKRPYFRVKVLIGDADYLRQRDATCALDVLSSARSLLPAVKDDFDRDGQAVDIARALTYLGDVQSAIKMMEAVQEPAISLIASSVACAQASAGDVPAALATMERIKPPVNRGFPQYDIARHYIKVGRMQDAETIASKIVPDDARYFAYMAIAEGKFARGDSAGGQAALDLAAKSIPDEDYAPERRRIRARGAELRAGIGDIARAEAVSAQLPTAYQERLAAAIAAAHAVDGDLKLARSVADRAAAAEYKLAATVEVARALARKHGVGSKQLQDWLSLETDPSVRVRAAIYAAEEVLGRNPLVETLVTVNP